MIHQHDIEDAPFELGERLQPIVGDSDGVTSFRQQSYGDALIDDVVLREQHVEGAGRAGLGWFRGASQRRRRVVEDAANRVVQLGRLDRLREIGGHAQVAASCGFPVVARRAEHHDRRPRQLRSRGDLFRHLEAVEVRHVEIEQDEHERAGRPVRLPTTCRAPHGRFRRPWPGCASESTVYTGCAG